MKLLELLENQKLTIQMSWGEQKIEFFSNVIEKDDSAVYVGPYIHNGSDLELNVIQGKGVICNIFTNDPLTKHRISWNNIELTTVNRKNKMMYCLKTNGYNHAAKHAERRKHDRLIVQTKAKVIDKHSNEGVFVIIHDISDIGISFYAPKNFVAKTHKLDVIFSETINDKTFNVNVECTIARVINNAENRFYGCRIIKENKDYQLYCFLKRLNYKNKITKPENADSSETESAETKEETKPEN